MISPDSDITGLLVDWNNGDKSAMDRLLPLVERELHRLAHAYMRRENPNHTLQTTALINETYLKLVDQRRVQWQNRAHFFGIAAQIMRRILLNYARDRPRYHGLTIVSGNEDAEKRQGSSPHRCSSSRSD